MSFDPLNYTMSDPFPVTQPGDLKSSYTTAECIKKYMPGQVAQTWDPLYGWRHFKLVKNLYGAALAQGQLVSNVGSASIGTVTAGTTTQITTSGQTANDFEYQMIVVADDNGGAGAAPEGEAALCVGNTASIVDLHKDYAFTTAVAVSDSVYVVYTNAVTLGVTGDLRGTPSDDKKVQGIVYSEAPADNSWFWILQKGWGRVLCTDALTNDCDIIQGSTSGYAAAFSAAHETVIGQCPVAQLAGSESGYATVYLDCRDVIFQTGTP